MRGRLSLSRYTADNWKKAQPLKTMRLNQWWYRFGKQMFCVLEGEDWKVNRDSLLLPFGDVQPSEWYTLVIWVELPLYLYRTPLWPSFKPHQEALDDGVSVFALVVDHFDVVQVSVGPVHQPVHQVQGDPVWENYFAVHQLCAVLAVHVTALHPRCRPIICEEHFSVGKGKRMGRLRWSHGDTKINFNNNR